MIVQPTLQQIVALTRGPLADAGALPWDPVRSEVVVTPAWTPASYSGLIAWYRETYAAGTWSDLSGNGRHLTQATAGLRPAQVTRAGQLALQFDGSDFVQGAYGSNQGAPVTIYCVAEPTTVAGSPVLFDGDDGTHRHSLYAPSDYALYGGSILAGPGTATTGLHGFCGIFAGPSSSAFVDNFATAIVTGDAGAQEIDGFTAGNNFAGSAGMTGYEWEIVIVSGAHNAANRALFAAYANARYSGLAITT